MRGRLGTRVHFPNYNTGFNTSFWVNMTREGPVARSQMYGYTRNVYTILERTPLRKCSAGRPRDGRVTLERDVRATDDEMDGNGSGQSPVVG